MTEPKAKKLWKDPITGIEYLTMTEEEMQKKTEALQKQVSSPSCEMDTRS